MAAPVSVSKKTRHCEPVRHSSALRAAAERRLRYARACGRSGVAISAFFKLFYSKIMVFYFYLRDRHTSLQAGSR